MQISQRDHVLDAPHAAPVHRLDAPLRAEPLLVAIVVQHLDAASFCRNDATADGNIELATGRRLDPYVVTLDKRSVSSFSWHGVYLILLFER